MKEKLKGVILETISEFKDRGVPSGHLYAALMQYVNLEMYQQIISELLREKKISEQGHLLKIVESSVNVLRTLDPLDASGDEFEPD